MGGEEKTLKVIYYACSNVLSFIVLYIMRFSPNKRKMGMFIVLFAP